MTPFDQDEALQKLLEQARSVEPKGNFVPNVMRAVRSMPQDRGRWAQLKGWWQDREAPWAVPALVGAAAVVAVALVQMQSPAAPEVAVAQPTQHLGVLAEEPVAPLMNLDDIDALLAMEDTSQLSDQELSFLLY